MLHDVALADPARKPYTACSLRTFHLEDPADIELVLGQHAECIQLSSGQFCTDLTHLQLGAVSLRRFSASGAFQLRRRVLERQLTLAYLNRPAPIMENGRRWLPDHLLLASGRDLDVSSLGPSEIVWIEIDLPLLSHSQFENVANRRWDMNGLAPAQRSALQELRTYAAAVLKLCVADVPVLESAGMCRRMESEILRRVVAVLKTSSAGSAALERERRAFSLVRRVERFMWENVEEPLTLERICANTNCRMRNLIYSFKDSFGIGPITYLKILRLNAVHRRLKKSRGAVRIFDVATDYGFWHMGHFSSNYKRMFGVTPTQTVWAANAQAEPAIEQRQFPGDPPAALTPDLRCLTASLQL
jgi:AraC family ethanolamine operon transcriptional activator